LLLQQMSKRIEIETEKSCIGEFLTGHWVLVECSEIAGHRWPKSLRLYVMRRAVDNGDG